MIYCNKPYPDTPSEIIVFFLNTPSLINWLITSKISPTRIIFFYSHHYSSYRQRKGKGQKVKVKIRTLDVAPLRESSPQKRSGMARVRKDLTVLPVHPHVQSSSSSSSVACQRRSRFHESLPCSLFWACRWAVARHRLSGRRSFSQSREWKILPSLWAG